MTGKRSSPIYGIPTTGVQATESLIFREIGDIHVIRKLSLEIFYNSIIDTSFDMVDPFKALFYIEIMGWRRIFEFTIFMDRQLHGPVNDGDIGLDINVEQKYEDNIALAGLYTAKVRPTTWCLRVLSFIRWKCKLNNHWLEWGRCMWETYYHYFLGDNCEQYRSDSWLASPEQVMRNEYERLHVNRSGWSLSHENSLYGLCANYPSVLALPSGLSEGQKRLAADSRSMNRMPALVWLHPHSRASLSRSAQPALGMSRSVEYDKIFFMAIKQASPFGLALRICDARPFLNASANAMQGKGYENVDRLGGPSVCAIVFLDIANIHIVR